MDKEASLWFGGVARVLEQRAKLVFQLENISRLRVLGRVARLEQEGALLRREPRDEQEGSDRDECYED